jgi:putative nucleotidyltransferase with HDIG domain
MSAEVEERPCEGDSADYLPVALDTLCPTPVLDFDLYLRPASAGSVVLYRERNFPLEDGDLVRLTQRGVETLYIPWEAQRLYRRYLFDMVIKNVGADPKQRYRVLTTATRGAFEAAFRSISPNHMVEFAREFGTHMADIVCSGDVLLMDLISLMQHDRRTYAHSVNVCTCAVALANMLWDDPAADLKPIAAGALMHDIGKRRIPRHIIRKRGGLSDEERELIRQHPAIGFEELCMRGDMSWEGLMTVYQHHERLDGGGYPGRLTGEEIHEWARICAIADVFDALRSDRSYRRAVPLDDVVEYLDARAGREFDEEMVRCWNSAITT